MKSPVHLLIVDSDGLCRTRKCGADDGHKNAATTFLSHVTCHDCIVAVFFPVRT